MSVISCQVPPGVLTACYTTPGSHERRSHTSKARLESATPSSGKEERALAWLLTSMLIVISSAGCTESKNTWTTEQVDLLQDTSELYLIRKPVCPHR